MKENFASVSLPFFLNCNDCVRKVFFFPFLCKTVIFVVRVKVIFFCIVAVTVMVILVYGK